MKKKLLSLVLAGAMVASTSVSAFATDTKDYEIEKDGTNAEVKIIGNIENSSGNILPGTVSVTVPTAAVFNVTSNGEVNSAAMNIVNNSEKSVSVSVSSFTDTTGTESIDLVKEDSIGSGSSRKNIFLKLVGGNKEVFFTSEQRSDGGYGKIYDSATKAALDNATEIATISKKDTLKLRLQGQGSTEGSPLGTPIADNFNLILKIKKVN